MNLKNKRFSKDDTGVSPVVGVILMVAITVVMAAIVSSWSSGVKAPTSPTTVGLNIQRSTTNISIIVTTINPASAAPIPYINATYTNSTGGYIYANMSSADVGNSTTVVTNENGPNQLMVVAKYKDGSSRVLYNQNT